MLVDVLNALTAPEATQVNYGDAARAMSSEERREASALHLAAVLGSLPHVGTSGYYEFPGLRLSLEETKEGGDIRYNDINIGFNVVGTDLSSDDGPSTMTGLLELLAYSRERSDAIFYVPQAMRNDRIFSLAERVGASERFVRFVLSNAPAIDRALAA